MSQNNSKINVRSRRERARDIIVARIAHWTAYTADDDVPEPEAKLAAAQEELTLLDAKLSSYR